MKKKTKTKSKSNHIVFILIFLIIVALISVVVLLKVKTVSDENATKASSKYETIMNYDFENNYPTSPDDVMDKYCYIISYLYSEEIKEEEIPDVVAKSRQLLHFVTVERTSLEAQIESVKQEREIIAGTNSYVTNAIHSKVLIDTQFPNYADCTITEYTKSGEALHGDYVLQMDNYKWKIYSWTLKGTSTQNAK